MEATAATHQIQREPTHEQRTVKEKAVTHQSPRKNKEPDYSYKKKGNIEIKKCEGKGDNNTLGNSSRQRNVKEHISQKNNNKELDDN